MKNLNRIYYLLILSTSVLFLTCSKDSNPELLVNSELKIVRPPNGGMYIGQTEIPQGAKDTLENAINRKVALFFGSAVMEGMEESDEHNLSFDAAKAQELWNQGYVVLAGAYEAYPGHGSFTVDKLLNGDYDADLHNLANQFKEFGKPMFFSTAREPNGVLADYFGGFGPDGDKNFGWAQANNAQFDAFVPPVGPVGNTNLYDGLGRSDICDGLERLAAAQRYYWDFFKRREGINFLTFETMGWAVPVTYDFESEGCSDLAVFYNMIANYSDWFSINWYMTDDLEPPIENLEPQDFIELLQTTIDIIRQVAPEKPVLITELGLCNNNTSRITSGLNTLINDYPEVAGFALWGTLDDVDCQINTGLEGDVFQTIIDSNPDKFYSSAYLSDGSRVE